MLNEIWKDIDGYEGLYQVSNHGRIKSFCNYGKAKERILKQRVKKGYFTIGLRKNNVRKWFSVHRLVAQAFIQNPLNLPCVNHKDENKFNNNVSNLEWCDAHYNNVYGTRIERVITKTGKKVVQLTKDNRFVCEYSSVSEAARKTNSILSGISHCCNGLYKQHNGYIWRFKDDCEVVYND